MVLPAPHPAVVCKPVSEGAVLLHTETEIYFGLNEVGRQIWDLLPPSCADLAEMRDRLAHEYPDADPAEIERDVAELLRALADEGLVVTP